MDVSIITDLERERDELYRKLDAAIAHGIDMEREVDKDKGEFARLYHEIYSLRDAIQTHRYNVWGTHDVQHDEDVALYKALEVSDG